MFESAVLNMDCGTKSELFRKVASIGRTVPADIGKLCERYKVTHSSELSAPTMEVGV